MQEAQAECPSDPPIPVNSVKVPRKRRKRRKRTPREKGYRYRGRLKRPGVSEALKEKWKDPVYRANQAAKQKAAQERRKALGLPGTRQDAPDGTLKKFAAPLYQQAKESAAQTMAELEKAGVLDDADEMAREALQVTIEVMRAPGDKDRRLRAARQVLDFTKAKPAAKQEVTINKAEEWLKQVAIQNDDEGATS